MPKTTSRYKNFLNHYEFHSNSVNFRIHSSKALEKFKNVQSFQLNQLANGKFYFAQDRREILLLKYDMWSRWIYEVENLMIELSGNHLNDCIKKEHIEVVIALAEKTDSKSKQIMTSEFADFFDQKFTSIWLEVHQSSFEFMLDSIKKLEGTSFDSAFTNIVDILCEVLQYTLIELHEIDSIFCKFVVACNGCHVNDLCPKNKKDSHNDRSIFVVINNFTKKCFQTGGKCLVGEKIKVYKKYFNFDEVYFKNYTNEPFSPEIINNIENTGVNINFKKSLVTY